MAKKEKMWEVIVTASWTYLIPAPDQDSAYEMVAGDLTKCTLDNMDDGTFYIEEPIETGS